MVRSLRRSYCIIHKGTMARSFDEIAISRCLKCQLRCSVAVLLTLMFSTKKAQETEKPVGPVEIWCRYTRACYVYRLECRTPIRKAAAHPLREENKYHVGSDQSITHFIPHCDTPSFQNFYRFYRSTAVTPFRLP